MHDPAEPATSNVEPISPQVGDGHDEDDQVVKAWLAIILYAGDVDRGTAGTILPLWRHHPSLNDAQRAAVLRRFPRPPRADAHDRLLQQLLCRARDAAASTSSDGEPE